MPLDAVCLTAVVQELRRELLGGRIDKIYQPTRDEVVLAVRGSRGNVRLLLSANPAHPRAQLGIPFFPGLLRRPLRPRHGRRAPRAEPARLRHADFGQL